MARGTFEFEMDADGAILDCEANVDKLRNLWLDRTWINGNDLGPGNAGDFDCGAWHVACHLVAASGARMTSNGTLLYMEISHDATADRYYPSISAAAGGEVITVPLRSAEGQALLRGSRLLGFIEGGSVGHISARRVVDGANRFNGWRRQDFDHAAESLQNGGKVWEHWCTMRDIRGSDAVASSVLSAYVCLAGALGDRFAPTVARGRREYGHPRQLCAMVRAGFTAQSAATWSTIPRSIPHDAELRLLEATPADGLAAAGMLGWSDEPIYYMFERRIDHWCDAGAVAGDLQRFGG